MLQGIRDRAQGVLMWIIVGLIIATFALWGIHQYFGPDVNVVVAKVNDREITLREFQDAYQRQRFRLQEMLGPEFDFGQLDDNRLKQESLKQMIDQELIFQAALGHGLRIGDTQLALQIRSVGAFQADGRFSEAVYENWLRNQGLALDYFEHSYRRSLLADQLQLAISGSTVVTDFMLDEAFRLQNQKRDFAYAVIPASRYAESVTVNDEEVEEYYAGNRLGFVNPEQVSIEYLELSRSAVAEEIKVDEQELQRRYEDQKARFQSAERRRASHILIGVSEDAAPGDVAEAEKKAQEIRERIARGESFEELARAHSEDPGSAESGGDLGFFTRGLMEKAFEDAAFGMQEGEVSDPVRSAFGFHVIKLVDIQAGEVKPLDQVRNEVRRELQLEKSEHLFFERAEQLANLTFESPDTLVVAGDALGLKIQESDFFTRRGGTGIAADRKVAAAAFSEDVLVRGNNSEPLELPSGRIVVLRVREHKPASDRPLDEVREEITDRLRKAKARKMATEQGQQIVQALREGADPEALGEEREFSWIERKEISRSGAQAPPSLIDSVFQLERPTFGSGVYGGTGLPSGDYAVIALKSVADGDLAGADQGEKDALRATLERGTGTDVFEAFVQALRAKAEIKVFPESME